MKTEYLLPRIAYGSIQAHSPEGAEGTLLLLAIHVGVLTSFNEPLFGLHECRVPKPLEPLRAVANLLVPAVADDAAFNSHSGEGCGGGEL